MLRERVTQLESARLETPSSWPAQTIHQQASGTSPLSGTSVSANDHVNSSRQQHVQQTPVERPASSSFAVGLLPVLPIPYGDQTVSSFQLDVDVMRGTDKLTPDEETIIFEVYHENIHCRYPFLRLDHLRLLDAGSPDQWIGFFINMIYSISLLVDKTVSKPRLHGTHQSFYQVAVTRYLPHILAQPDRLLHIQAYLLLAMHALYSTSSENLISLVSLAMRYCVVAQLHLASPEYELVDVSSSILAQIRRRIFWSAYALDRVVSAAFDLPFSIADELITAKMYANVDDKELEQKCQEYFPEDPPDMLGYTSVSAAFHIISYRRIQSDIMTKIRPNDTTTNTEWINQILDSLEHWKNQCSRYANPQPGAQTDQDWFLTYYHYSLTLLSRQLKHSSRAVKHCANACLLYRKFLKTALVHGDWLAIISQFRCGVSLLYHLYASYSTSDTVSLEITRTILEATRVCTVTLSIFAEQWPQVACLRDAFDILFQEITNLHTQRALMPNSDLMIDQACAATLNQLVKELAPLVICQDTLRMIREMTLPVTIPGRPQPLS